MATLTPTRRPKGDLKTDIAPTPGRAVALWLRAVLDRPMTSYHLVLGSVALLLVVGLRWYLARAKDESGGKKTLVVTGCLTQRYAKDLEVELPEVDVFLGTGDFHRIGEVVDKLRPAAIASALPHCPAPVSVVTFETPSRWL